MAVKKPARPHLKKAPKQPKASASIDAWKAYESRVKATDAENSKKIADYKKKLAAYEAEQRKKESIKKMAEKAKAKLSGF
ncbi:MAG: hypothetical protein IIW86_03505 [Clostridia bacterium]|jgi:hypothetical protein|nr:hypothetical protein [Clostridia bacterium]